MQHISWVFVCHQVYPRSKKAEIQRDFVAITKMDVSMNSLLVRAKFFSLRFKTAFMNLYHPTCLYSQHHLPNKTSFPASGAWSLPPLHPRSLGVTMVPGATKASPKEGSQRLPNQRLPLKKRGKPREGMDNEIHNDMFWGFDNVWYQRCLIWFALGIPSASEMSRWCWCHVAAHVVCTREIIRCSCWPMTKSLRVNWFLVLHMRFDLVARSDVRQAAIPKSLICFCDQHCRGAWFHECHKNGYGIIPFFCDPTLSIVRYPPLIALPARSSRRWAPTRWLWCTKCTGLGELGELPYIILTCNMYGRFFTSQWFC